MILFILSSLTLLSGCDSNQRQQTKEKQPQVSELSISVDAGLVTDDFLDFIDSFSSTHKIDIQLNERPSGTAGENEVTTELLTIVGGFLKHLTHKNIFMIYLMSIMLISTSTATDKLYR